ncbi:energy transducer TonB [Flavobacterium ardleyense]|uniref:Energy transducer TonB n=1 Tax=Flavobacterium ardleyense TaxID=2038737 RepID=A0ABW5Z8P5_9FLAO
MKRIFLLFFILLFCGSIVAQKKTSAQIKKEAYELKLKQEWESYLVKVEKNNTLKTKLKTEKDSLNSLSPKKDSIICDNIRLPFYEKTDNLGNKNEISVQEYISMHIRNNFNYPEFAMEHNIQGRVVTTYTINKEGDIVGVSAEGPENGLILEQEAIRIIKKLPRCVPGLCDDKPTSIRHVVPITFKL